MTKHPVVNSGVTTQHRQLRLVGRALVVHETKEGLRMQREVPLWLAVVIIVVVVIIIAGIYWWRWHPKVQEGAQPPPTAPIFKAGPGLGGEKPIPEQPTK
jgi:H+/Cl- antiporter ClcA